MVGCVRLHRDMELRKLPPAAVFGLVQALECSSAWKQVMALVLRSPTPSNPCPVKYTAQHIKMVEVAGSKQQRPCTEIFLEEWGCSGRVRPTVKTLLDLLVQAQLYRAVEFVSVQLLKEPPPPRPTSGPAAAVDISNSLPNGAVFNAAPPASFTPVFISRLPSAPPAEETTFEDRDVLAVQNLPQINDLNICGEPSNTVFQQNSVNEDESRRLVQHLDTLPIEEIRGTRHVPFADLHLITNGFDERPVTTDGRLLGTGAFGSVFLAVQGNNFTAVKRLHDHAVNTNSQFHNEVEALSRIQHPNLLPLLAYSHDGPAKCLVYEYMSQGNLQERLACQSSWKVPLPWPVRVKVASGTAEGLNYLHSCGSRPLVHRDVKSANILLGDKLEPKLGDFGLVRLGGSGQDSQSVAVTTTVFGTSAYMAPEAFRGDVSVKMDTFSFGVVLLELLTGLPPFDESREGCDLLTYVDEACDDSILPLLDKSAGNWQSSKAVDLSECLYSLAKDCLKDKRERPVMSIVVSKLQNMCQEL